MSELSKLRNALSSEETFEFLAREYHGDKYVDRMLNNAKIIVENVFHDDLNISDKAKNIVEILKKEHEKFLETEIKAGVFDNKELIENYVYHMLNPKYINNKQFEKTFISSDYGFNQRVGILVTLLENLMLDIPFLQIRKIILNFQRFFLTN